MNAAEQLPETHRHKPERGRLTTRGRATDDGSWTTLLDVHEVDGSWTIYGLGAPGLTSTRSTWSRWPSILERARHDW